MYTLRFNLGKTDLVIVHIMADFKPFKLYLINIYIDRCVADVIATYFIVCWLMLLPWW